MRPATRWSSLAAGMLVVGLVAGYAVRHARADGVPSEMTYSGTLEDAAGVPISGGKKIGLNIYDAQTGGAVKCALSPAQTNVANGRFSLDLPAACVTEIKANPKLYVEIVVENESLGRAQLGSVPYAIEAGAASEAKGALKSAVEGKAEKTGTPVFTDWSTSGAPVFVTFAPAGTLQGSVSQKWRREGDSIHVVACSTVDPSSTGGFIAYQLGGIPGSPQIDFTKVPDIAGVVAVTVNGVFETCYTNFDPAGPGFVARCASQQYGLTVPATKGKNICFDVTVPVQGWSTL